VSVSRTAMPHSTSFCRDTATPLFAASSTCENPQHRQARWHGVGRQHPNPQPAACQHSLAAACVTKTPALPISKTLKTKGQWGDKQEQAQEQTRAHTAHRSGCWRKSVAAAP
jgi:hypothetical protein